MTPSEMKLALQEVLATGISLNTSSYVVLACVWFLGTVIAGFVGAFFHRRGETARAEIMRDFSIEQRRWDAKFQCYSQIAESFAELALTLELVMRLMAEVPTATGDPAVDEASAHEHAEKIEKHIGRIAPAVEKINRFSTVARIAVEARVRTLLSTFADRFNVAGDLRSQYQVAYRGWLAVIDVARADLFGELREMTDEEALA